MSKDIKAVIPEECFKSDTATSLGYLSVSLFGTALCTALGVATIGAIGTSIWTLPIWTAYAGVTGTVAMGLWVLAHECGTYLSNVVTITNRIIDANFLIH